MPNNNKSYKAVQSYQRYDSDKVSKIQLPDNIRCIRCEKKKNQHCFAKNRLGDLQAYIYGGARPGFNAKEMGYIACNMRVIHSREDDISRCTGGQVNELHCIHCDKTRGLDAFSKAQRKNPDKATCWSCMETRLNTEPGDSDSNPNNSSNEDSESDDSTCGGGTTIAGTFSSMSIANGSSATGGVALPGSTASGNFASHASSTTTSQAGISKAVAPHARNKAPASVAGSDITERTSGGGKFAKLKAVPVKFNMDAARRVEAKDREDELDGDDVCVSSDEDDSD